jgi:PAS domain S-box-containing protein
MSTLLLTLTRINLWHFIWIAVVLAVLWSILLSELIHGQIVWEYPFAATFITVTVASLLIYLLKRLRKLEQALAEQAGHRVQNDNEQERTEAALRERQKLSSAFKDAAIGMALVKTDGQWLQVNPALCALVGYTEQELLATTFQAITHPADLDADLAFVRQMLTGEIRTYQMEKRYFHKHGQVVWILLSVSLVRDPFGQPLYFISQIQDITERKQVEEALRKSEVRYRQLIELSQDAIYVLDDRGIFTLTNPAGCTLLGYTEQELVGMSVVHTYRAEERPAVAERLQQLQMGGPLRFERVAVRKNGTTVPIEVCLSPMTHRHYQAVVRDITDRKRVEEKLHESEARLRAILDNSPNMIFLKDTEGRYLLVNRQFERMFLLDQKTIVGKTDVEIFSPQQAAVFQANDRKVIQDGIPLQFEFEEEALHDDGPHTSIVFKFPLRTIDGILYGIGGITTDITERKQAEEERKKQERLVTLMLSTGPGCIKRLAADGTLHQMNPAGLKMIEADCEEDALGLSVFNLVVPEHRAAFMEMHRDVINGCTRTLQFEILGLRGTRRWMETYAVPFRNPVIGQTEHLAVTHDITERYRAEEALRASEQRLRQALDDRERLSQDLHDHVIQSIYAIGMALESCQYLSVKDPGLAAPEIAEQYREFERRDERGTTLH